MIGLASTPVLGGSHAGVHCRTERPSLSNNITATTDRRALRTRGALRDALIELIGERGWDDIAVQDICDRADVARSTFYVHYAGKEALLQGGLDDLRAALRTQAPSGAAATGGDWSGFAFIGGLVRHAQQNQRIFRSVVGRRSSYAVHERFRETVVRLIDEELPASDGALPQAARARCLGALLTELLGWWVDNGAQDAQALADRFNRAAAALLAAE